MTKRMLRLVSGLNPTFITTGSAPRTSIQLAAIGYPTRSNMLRPACRGGGRGGTTSRSGHSSGSRDVRMSNFYASEGVASYADERKGYSLYGGISTAPYSQRCADKSWNSRRLRRRSPVTMTFSWAYPTESDIHSARSSNQPNKKRKANPTKGVPDLIADLIRHQSFDGSWTLDDARMGLFWSDTTSPRDACPDSCFDIGVWATALAIACFERFPLVEQETWELVVDKANR